jgi:N-methylhydantoinase B/oxoprolinase/acetone carboxylase alpha subunit
MNNLTFGDDTFGYYETIGGGTGAGPGFPGASGVHSHMTNTRITDPEILERRTPSFYGSSLCAPPPAARENGGAAWGSSAQSSSGAPLPFPALWSGGPRPLSVSRAGGAGMPGQNWLLRGEEPELLPGHVTTGVQPGDILIIETPGGGGYGAER